MRHRISTVPGLFGITTALVSLPPERTTPASVLVGPACPRDGCLVSWPLWRDGQPKCKLCALDEDLAQLRRTGHLTHRARTGKQYERPRQQPRWVNGWWYEPVDDVVQEGAQTRGRN